MAEGKRLVIFGDSIAKGVTYQDGRYHLCSEHNFDALAQKGIMVSNFAKMGACSDTVLAIAKKRLRFGKAGMLNRKKSKKKKSLPKNKSSESRKLKAYSASRE